MLILVTGRTDLCKLTKSLVNAGVSKTANCEGYEKGVKKKSQPESRWKTHFQVHPQDNSGFAQQKVPQIYRKY